MATWATWTFTRFEWAKVRVYIFTGVGNLPPAEGDDAYFPAILYRRHEARRSRASPGGGSVAVFVATVPLSSVYFRAPGASPGPIFLDPPEDSSIVIRAILISRWSWVGASLGRGRVGLGASLSFVG